MQNLETLKNRSQEAVSNLVERGKDQPEETKMWGVTAAAGVAGALAITAVAKGVLAVVATLANPPVALTVGALGGGALGWSYMQKQAHSADAEQPQAATERIDSVVDTLQDAVAEQDDAPTADTDAAGDTKVEAEADSA